MADHDTGWGRFASIGLEVAAGVGLGIAVGLWLDRRYQWSPWGTLIGALLGLVTGIYMLIRDTLRMNKD
jgi:F0F1-type ATP synthase assembly protein I